MSTVMKSVIANIAPLELNKESVGSRKENHESHTNQCLNTDTKKQLQSVVFYSGSKESFEPVNCQC